MAGCIVQEHDATYPTSAAPVGETATFYPNDTRQHRTPLSDNGVVYIKRPCLLAVASRECSSRANTWLNSSVRLSIRGAIGSGRMNPRALPSVQRNSVSSRSRRFGESWLKGARISTTWADLPSRSKAPNTRTRRKARHSAHRHGDCKYSSAVAASNVGQRARVDCAKNREIILCSL